MLQTAKRLSEYSGNTEITLAANEAKRMISAIGETYEK
jgi:hypothetical protein